MESQAPFGGTFRKGKIPRAEYEELLNRPMGGFGYILNRLVEMGKLTLQEAEEFFNRYRGPARGFGWGFGRGWGRGWKHRRGWGWNT